VAGITPFLSGIKQAEWPWINLLIHLLKFKIY
jgi:hypothetical protein